MNQVNDIVQEETKWNKLLSERKKNVTCWPNFHSGFMLHSSRISEWVYYA